MKRILLTVLAAAACTGAFAQSGEKNFLDQNYLEITGHAQMEVAPNRIYIEITLKDSDTKNKVSVEEQQRTLYRVLKGLGVDTEKQLKVNDLSSSFVKRRTTDQIRSFRLTVDNAVLAQQVFTALDDAGISNLFVSRVDNSDMAKYRTQVKVGAIKNAQENARALAEAIGQSIGKAIYIQENNYNYRPYNVMMLSARKSNAEVAEDAGGATDLQYQDMTLDATILVRFELK